MRYSEELVGYVAAILIMCSVASAQSRPVEPAELIEIPTWPECEYVIEFEVLDEPLKAVEIEARPGQVWPRFAAVVVVDDDYPFYTPNIFRIPPGVRDDERADLRAAFHEEVTGWLLATETSKRFSDQQREFVRDSDWYHREFVKKPKTNTLEWYRFALYAVTENDARLMGQAVMEVFDGARRKRFEEFRKQAVQLRDKVSKKREELIEAEQRRFDVTFRFAEKTDGTPYRNRAQAVEDIDRLLRALRSIEIDIAGIEAKTNAIRELQIEKKDTAYGDTIVMLERALIEQDIEMAGALARRAAVNQHLSRAEEARDLGAAMDESVRAGESLREAYDKDLAEYDAAVDKLRFVGLSALSPVTAPAKLRGKIAIQRIDYTDSE